MKVRFCGPTLGASGYSEFARFFVYALHQQGVEVGVEPIQIDPKRLDFGIKGKVANSLIKKVKDPDINIVNMLPVFFDRYSLKSCKNVGFTMFEANKLPDLWVQACNKMDAIFVPSIWNQQVFQDSGVKVPVYVVPPGVISDEVPLPQQDQQDKFNFYSIFQWTERKNPEGLLRAFYAAFTGNDEVRLILKTYRSAKMNNNTQFITQEIEKIKKTLNLKHYPEVVVETDFFSTQQMKNLHSKGDCFVLPTRSEGWGLPIFNALLHGNPAIATGYSSQMDFMSVCPELTLDFQLTPVKDMGWYVPWFDGTMLWAEADLSQLIEKMKNVYEDPGCYSDSVKKVREHILQNFNEEQPAKIFIEAAENILRK